MIRVITFDFGNVVGFFDYGPALQRLAAETGVPALRLREAMLDTELEHLLEVGGISGADFFERVRRACGLHCSPELLARHFADIFRPNPEVCGLIPRLQGRYRLLLGSNTNEIHARHFRRQFAEVLGHLDHLVLSHEIGQRKPGRQFFEHCQRQAGHPPEECLFIDDLPANVAAARECGWQAILYRIPGELERQLAELGVTIPNDQ